MDDENINSETLADEPHMSSADGGESVVVVDDSYEGAAAQADNISLSDIERELGKKFPSKEAALKAFKDTFSYVGKKKDDIVKNEIQEKGYLTRDEFEKEFFFRDNPQHAKSRDILEALAQSKKISLREASELPTYKDLTDKAVGYDKVQSARSVLETNPRLAQATNARKDVAKLVASGNKDAAEQAAARAVLDAFSE